MSALVAEVTDALATPDVIAQRIISKDGDEFVARSSNDVLYWDTKFRVRVRIGRILTDKNRRDKFFDELCSLLKPHHWAPYGNMKGACWAGKTQKQMGVDENNHPAVHKEFVETEKWMFHHVDVPQQAGHGKPPSIDTVLETVVNERFMTLGHPAQMTDDELADVVIRMFVKIREMLPYIVALKARFDDGERNSLNQLKTPIKGCSSWKDFCQSILNRTPQAVGRAMLPAKVKNLGSRLTGVDVAEYEREHPDIRQFARNLLTQMSESDAVSALVNQGTPEGVAEVLVRLVAAEKLANREPSPAEPESPEPDEPELSAPEKVAQELQTLLETVQEEGTTVRVSPHAGGFKVIHTTVLYMSEAEIREAVKREGVTA